MGSFDKGQVVGHQMLIHGFHRSGNMTFVHGTPVYHVSLKTQKYVEWIGSHASVDEIKELGPVSLETWRSLCKGELIAPDDWWRKLKLRIQQRQRANVKGSRTNPSRSQLQLFPQGANGASRRHASRRKKASKA